MNPRPPISWFARCAKLVCLAGVATAGPILAEDGPGNVNPPAELARYVAAADPAFRWEARETRTVPEGTIYDLHLVSQEWQGIPWDHQLQIYHPAGAPISSTMLLWNQGGAAREKDVAFGWDLARRVGGPIAFLYGIPRQPLFDGMKEDTLIAETFVRYLETKDARWPLLFPMVKSLVRAMDVLQEFARQEWQRPLTGFVVSGASKRGWTTWLTAAADRRVAAIAPLVIDTLNMQAQGPYQLRSFGHYSEQIRDYTERGLVPMPDTPEAHALWRMVDPWSYRGRLTVPKMIINGANDPYWTTDALNLYWDDLPGEKWVLYVPNAGHGLEQHHADGRKDRERALNGLASFTRHIVKGNPMPQVRWTHEDTEGQARLTVVCDPAPQSARVWVADAPSRDFRQAPWAERAARQEGGEVSVTMAPPGSGCRVFFAELDFEVDGLSHQVSTQMRILEAAVDRLDQQ